MTENDLPAGNEWQHDRGAIGILGKKQTGKTTGARQQHAFFGSLSDRVSVWIMPRDEAVPRVKGGGDPVGSKKKFLEAIRDGRTHIVWKTTDVAGALEDFKDVAWKIADQHGREGYAIQVIVDEIHNIAPEQATKEQRRGRDIVRKIAKEGEKRGVKLVGITQDPTSWDKQTLRQMEYLLIFMISPIQTDPFQRWGIDWGVVADLDPHCAVLYQNELEGRSGEARLLREQVCPSEKYAV